MGIKKRVERGGSENPFDSRSVLFANTVCLDNTDRAILYVESSSLYHKSRFWYGSLCNLIWGYSQVVCYLNFAFIAGDA